MEYLPTPAKYEQYPELNALRTAALSASTSIENSEVTYPEVARTKGALYAQAHIHDRSPIGWHNLTKRQTKNYLTYPTFLELNDLSRQAMPDAETYLAVEYINYIHDIFKRKEYMRAVGLEPENDSHDEGLRRLFAPEHTALRKEILPSFDKPGVFSDHQRYLIEGVFTSDFNFIRFVQSQTSEREVEAIANMPRDVLLCSILHGIHDVGGALGDKNETSSLTLDEHATTRFLDAAYALLGSADELGLPADSAVTPRWRRSAYRSLRAHRIGLDIQPQADKSLQPEMEMTVKLTLADFLRCYTREDFGPINTVFNRLPLALRNNWAQIHALSMQFPESLTRSADLGSEYGLDFLTSLGMDEESLYLNLGYLAQIYLFANLLPSKISLLQNKPIDSRFPYDTVNFYPLTKWFKENPQRAREGSIYLEHKITQNTVSPRVTSPLGRHGDIFMQHLVHPDTFHLESE